MLKEMIHCGSVTLFIFVLLASDHVIGCQGAVEESFVRLHEESDGTRVHTFSDGKVMVTAILDSQGTLFDCHVMKNNNTAAKQFFKEVVLNSRSKFTKYSMADIDVRKLGRKCRKFIRDTLRKKDEKTSEIEKLSRERLSLDETVDGTRWCTRLQRPSNYKKLGEKQDLDKCCYDYHKCDGIPPFTYRNSFLNYFPWKLSECACAEEFTKCLKDVATSEALQFGERIFNKLRLPCLRWDQIQSCVSTDLWHFQSKESEVKKVAIKQDSPIFST